MNELTELRQSSALLERVCIYFPSFFIINCLEFLQEKLNLQVEIDSLRGQLSEEETAHKKLQEQLLMEKLKRAFTNIEIDHHSAEIIKGISSSLLSLSHLVFLRS